MLCVDLEEWDGTAVEERLKREGMCVCVCVCVCVWLWLSIYIELWPVSIVVWQKSTQHCKAIILQLKNKIHIKKN